MKRANATTCCIVGGGPAGVVLSLLLARQRISVTLLESHKDFNRQFRGDTLHASVLENLDQIGLAEPVLSLSHARIEKLRFVTAMDDITIADFSRMKTEFPYVALIPQDKFLEFLVQEARKFDGFQLIMGASAQDLIKENGRICGVRYRADGQTFEHRALLTVAADGRGSRMRKRAGAQLLRADDLGTHCGLWPETGTDRTYGALRVICVQS